MIRNKYIFFLGTTKFDGSEQSTSFTIAKQLARDNFVFYIDYPFTWKDCLRSRYTEQFKRRRPYFSPFSDGVISTDTPNFKVVINLPMLSINFLPEGALYRGILKLNELLIRRRLKKVIRNNKISDFVFINSFNFHYPGIADKLDPQLTVYHCVDPMIMPYDMKHGIISEAQLVRNSDLVICTSRQLYDEKKLLNPNTFFIPNAADIGHSSQALDKSLLIDERISNLKKPIIGYLGTIERRMDYDLLKEVIEKNKDKNFVFAGPLNPEYVPEWFTNTPNIMLLGQIPYDQIPNVTKGFDVAIIPFKKDKVSATIFPLKLFEYLGAGKPVIATNFNSDLEEFTRGTVAFCGDATSFSKAIDDILKNDNLSMQQKRIAVARENTWEKRGNEISELIDLNLI